MPHISWPMRFVLPYHKDMRFEGDTPTSKLLTVFMPWMKGRRPAWLIRLGLFMYDNLGGREILPGTKTLDLRSGPEGAPLVEKFERAYEYSDCWIEDSRLVILNARRGTTRCQDYYPHESHRAERKDGVWTIQLDQGGAVHEVTAKAIVNAGGPWVEDVIRGVVRLNATEGVRLVRGSHIVTKRLFDHDKSYFFQAKTAGSSLRFPTRRTLP